MNKIEDPIELIRKHRQKIIKNLGLKGWCSKIIEFQKNILIRL